MQSEADFVREAMDMDMLDVDTETMLARAWRDEGNEQAMHRLVNAHIRLAIAIASRYHKSRTSREDLIQEASFGLMKATEKFDPDRGVRFATYAKFWIETSIQQYTMRNNSAVRADTKASHKKLFFNLRKVRGKLEQKAQREGEVLTENQLMEMIAHELNVPLLDVKTMWGQLSGPDLSLNAQQSVEDEGREWQDLLKDESPQAADITEREHDLDQLKCWMFQAMNSLDERERHVLTERKLIEPIRTLDDISKELGISRERVRQIEQAAIQKLRKLLKNKPELAALVF